MTEFISTSDTTKLNKLMPILNGVHGEFRYQFSIQGATDEWLNLQDRLKKGSRLKIIDQTRVISLLMSADDLSRSSEIKSVNFNTEACEEGLFTGLMIVERKLKSLIPITEILSNLTYSLNTYATTNEHKRAFIQHLQAEASNALDELSDRELERIGFWHADLERGDAEMYFTGIGIVLSEANSEFVAQEYLNK
jgi:hypothetical protein